MPSWKEPAVITQFGSKGHAPSLAYAGMNTLVWIIYVALVLLVTQMLPLHTPVAITAVTLAAAILLNPLRRRVAHAAKRRLDHR